MIHVEPAPEPDVFEQRVRKPGKTFLALNPKPTAKEFEPHSYWRKILSELRDSYRSVCAYSCHFVPYDTGADTVEHFLPKVPHPADAYEWSNYRFVCSRLNGRKGKKEDVVDPFLVEDGWFQIEFPSLLVKPAPDLDLGLKKRVVDSRDRIGLNDESTCLKQRQRYVRDYCTGNVSFALLERDAPFLAMEIRRQGLVESLYEIMGYARGVE